MPDYKEMYLTLFHATTKAIDLLTTTQQECEEIFISAPDPELKLVPMIKEQEKGADGK